MPRSLDYTSLYERFSRDLPRNYNVGVDLCESHAGGKGRLAIIHDHEGGTAEEWTFRELEKHEYLREVEFVDELLTTATSKIRRNVLREREAREGAKR